MSTLADTVGNFVRRAVGDSVDDALHYAILKSVGDSHSIYNVKKSIYMAVRISVYGFIPNAVYYSVRKLDEQ